MPAFMLKRPWLAGRKRALLNVQSANLFAALGGKIRPFNLSLVSEFDDRLIDHLRLRPMQ